MNTLEKTRRLMAGVLKRPVAEIGDHAHLRDDLKADSLHAVEIALEIKDAFDIEISDAEAESALTVAALAKLVDGKMMKVANG